MLGRHAEKMRNKVEKRVMIARVSRARSLRINFGVTIEARWNCNVFYQCGCCEQKVSPLFLAFFHLFFSSYILL